MTEEPKQSGTSAAQRFLAGVLAPAILQAIALWCIIASTKGDGSFSGMAIFFMSPFILGITALLNLLTLRLHKPKLKAVFACGLIAPSIVSFLVWFGFTIH